MALDDDNNLEQPEDIDLDISDEEAEGADVGEANVTNKKKAIVLGVVVGLVVLAGIVVFSLVNKPDTTDDVLPPPRTAQKTGKQSVPPSAPPAENAATPENPTVNTNQPIDDSGTLSRPMSQNWVKGITQPLPVPNGLKATPGIEGSNTPQISLVQQNVGNDTGSGKAGNTDQVAMQQLWKQGANAKHRGDYAAARKAWESILQMDPGHPGIQEAINKLPR